MVMIDSFISTNHLNGSDGSCLRLCLDELVNNVISYGYNPGNSGKIIVEIKKLGNEVLVWLIDDGHSALMEGAQRALSSTQRLSNR